MAETKDEIAAERDALREENARLTAQLQAAGAAPRVVAPKQTFVLSEGDRQDLAARGATNIGGVLLTRDEVRAKLAEPQQGIDLGDAPIDPALQQVINQRRKTGGHPGLDYVYPSVAPGQIDPAVAGTPGISGPAADSAPSDLDEQD